MDGFKGLRTLVVGVAHVCTCQCDHKDKCCNSATVRDMDTGCPYYQGRDAQYYCLSNSNEIEIQSFIDKEASYSAYKAFTCYMLRLTRKCTTEDRSKLWESVAFTNFLQYYLADDDDDVATEEFEKAYPSFEEVVAELDPQVIVAWNPEICDCLCRHSDAFRHVGKADMDFQLELYVFVPKSAGLTSAQIDNIRRKYNAHPSHGVKYFRDKIDSCLKQCFIGEDADIQRKYFADFLKDCFANGLICDKDDYFAFCNDRSKWSTYHKAYFCKEIKMRFGLKAYGANGPLCEFFNCPSLVKYSTEPNKSKKTAQQNTTDSLLAELNDLLDKHTI